MSDLFISFFTIKYNNWVSLHTYKNPVNLNNDNSLSTEKSSSWNGSPDSAGNNPGLLIVKNMEILDFIHGLDSWKKIYPAFKSSIIFLGF